MRDVLLQILMLDLKDTSRYQLCKSVDLRYTLKSPRDKDIFSWNIYSNWINCILRDKFLVELIHSCRDICPYIDPRYTFQSVQKRIMFSKNICWYWYWSLKTAAIIADILSWPNLLLQIPVLYICSFT